MPMILLTLAAFADLRLSAELVGLRVQASVHNDGDRPAAVVTGDRCTGPAFRLVVDGKPRPFVELAPKCPGPSPVTRTLAPRASYSALSDTLDGRQHHIEVYLGALPAATLEVPTLVRVDLVLHASAHVRAGEPVDLELAHVNKSAEPITIPSCGEDRMLVDDKESPLSLAEPCRAEPTVLPRRGALIARARLSLPPGHHRLRARWREGQSNDVYVEVGP